MLGKYLKHVRGIPQSPWIVDGVRRSTASVEELIAAPVMKAFGVRIVAVLGWGMLLANSCGVTALTTAWIALAVFVSAEV